MPRTSNEILCDEFRHLLTHGFYVEGDNDAVLELTKPWRNDLWRKFTELEDRLCPMRAKQREEAKKG